MLTKHKQPIASTETTVFAEWQPMADGTISMVGAELKFNSHAYIYGYEKQSIGESGYKLDPTKPTALPPAQYIPEFTNAEDMLRWVLGFLYENEKNKQQLGAD